MGGFELTRVLRKILFFALAAFAAVSLLSGCYPSSIENLYSLPKTSEKNVKLQNLINEEIAQGAEFSAPTRGGYRQSVQQYDIDGDGIDETFAFFLDSDKALKICVYTGDDDDGYAHAATIKGGGTSIGSIEYADIDGDNIVDLIVVWQSGTGDMRLLQIFAMRDFEAAPLLTVSCSEFVVTDFDGDAIPDVAVMTYDNAENDIPAGGIELYRFPPDKEPESSAAGLSRGLGQGTVTRMRVGLLSDLRPALYVEGQYGENDLITDIFVYTDGAFRNITLDLDSAVSEDTVRLNYREPYSRDIDSDRSLETPITVPMYVQENTNGYFVMDWYSYDSAGKRNLDISTYHASDGWYIILPKEWRQTLTVRRSDGAAGERTIVLSSYDKASGEIRDFLIIYTLTGENRRDRARLPDRFILREDDTSTIYAARTLLDKSQWQYALSPEEILENFKIVYPEWTTGAI